MKDIIKAPIATLTIITALSFIGLGVAILTGQARLGSMIAVFLILVAAYKLSGKFNN